MNPENPAMEKGPQGGWPFLRRLVACEVAATLLCGGYIGLVLEPHNRLYMLFNREDTAALILLVAAGGFLAASLLHALAGATRGRSDRWLSPWFFFGIVLAAFNFRPALRLTLVDYLPWLTGTVYYLLIWALGGALTVAAYRKPRWRDWAAAGWRYSVYLWPILPILLFNLCMAPRWENVSGAPSRLGHRVDGKGAPVLIVILDMIGYEDLFADGGRVKDELPRLGDFAKTSTVYHRARAPGDETGRSMPGFLLQEEVGIVELGRGPAQWAPTNRPGASAKTAAEFEEALPYAFRQAGYRRVLIGYYLPFKALMPGAFDEVFIRSYYGAALSDQEGSPLGAAILHQLVRLVEESKDPVSAVAKQFQLHIRPFKQYFRNLTAEVQAEGLRHIRDSLSPGDFAVIHLPVPHQPYVFDAEGGRGQFGYLNPAGYPAQLEYADRLFGELMEALRETGMWDESWVIVLSDHGPHFRDYNGTSAGKRHVPLMVKAPGQEIRRDVDVPIRLVDLGELPDFPLRALTAEAGETGRGDVED